MSEADLEYDEVGKLDLHDVYNRPTPVGYFSTLSQLDYRVAEEVRPVLRRLIEARRELKPTDDINTRRVMLVDRIEWRDGWPVVATAN